MFVSKRLRCSTLNALQTLMPTGLQSTLALAHSCMFLLARSCLLALLLACPSCSRLLLLALDSHYVGIIVWKQALAMFHALRFSLPACKCQVPCLLANIDAYMAAINARTYSLLFVLACSLLLARACSCVPFLVLACSCWLLIKTT